MKKYAVPGLRALLVLLSPLGAILACQLVSLQHWEAAWQWLLDSPGPAGAYYLALLLAQLTLTGLTRLSGLAGLLAALPPFALTLVSYYKSAINGEPLTLADLGLAAHLGDITRFAAENIVITPAVWGAIALLAALLIALTALDILSLLGRDPLRLSLGRGLALAGAGGVLTGLFLVLFLRPYCVDQFKAYPIQGARDGRLGVSLSLLSAWYCAKPSPSVSYSQAHLLDILEDMEGALARQETREDRPHIIFVMNESFKMHFGLLSGPPAQLPPPPGPDHLGPVLHHHLRRRYGPGGDGDLYRRRLRGAGQGGRQHRPGAGGI